MALPLTTPQKYLVPPWSHLESSYPRRLPGLSGGFWTCQRRTARRCGESKEKTKGRYLIYRTEAVEHIKKANSKYQNQYQPSERDKAAPPHAAVLDARRMTDCGLTWPGCFCACPLEVQLFAHKPLHAACFQTTPTAVPWPDTLNLMLARRL